MRVRRAVKEVTVVLCILGMAQFVMVPARSTEPTPRSYLTAANQGDPHAQFALGWIYESGRGAPRDYAKAFTWYQKAAAQGFAPAQSSIGYLYQTGHGVARDDAKAVEWYKRAAAAGDLLGEFLLGVAYINGAGVQRNAKLAAQWIYKSAKAGHQQSQLMLATMLQEGLGVTKNEFAARRWFDKAAHGPDATIATKASTIRDKIDEHVLFSGAFRPEDIQAALAVGFGLGALMFAISPPMSQEEWDKAEAEVEQENAALDEERERDNQLLIEEGCILEVYCD